MRKYIKSILLFSISQLLISCTNLDVVSSRYEDYTGEDHAILSVNNFATHMISIYKKDEARQCLVQDGFSQVLTLKEPLIPNFTRGVFSNSPFKHLEKYLSESKVKADTYVKVVERSNNALIEDQVFKFIVQDKGYYYLKQVANKPIYNLDRDTIIDEVFYLLPNEKGLYNTEIYFKEIKKYHFKFSPAKTDSVIHYKGGIPAKKWDLPEC